MKRRMQTAGRLIVALGVAATALCAQSALAQSAPGQGAPASAANLPPPPYAADERVAAQHGPVMGGPQRFDRYSGGGSHPSLQPAIIPSLQPATAPMRADVAYQGPHLAWAGKTETTTVAAPPQPRPTPVVRYVPPQPFTPRAPSPPVQTQAQNQIQAQSIAPQPISPQPRYPEPTYARATQAQPPAAESAPAGWRYIAPIGPRGQEPALPTSIYAPVPSATAQEGPAPAPSAEVATAAPAGGRRYSVHREYGIQPDPIPLPPQFFGATADMSKPETDEPARRTVTADGKSHNALQPSDGQ